MLEQQIDFSHNLKDGDMSGDALKHKKAAHPGEVAANVGGCLLG
jgi:hypothetical protein